MCFQTCFKAFTISSYKSSERFSAVKFTDFLHLKMPVPKSGISQLFSVLLMCLITYFAIWLGTSRFKFSAEFGIFVILLLTLYCSQTIHGHELKVLAQSQFNGFDHDHNGILEMAEFEASVHGTDTNGLYSYIIYGILCREFWNDNIL